MRKVSFVTEITTYYIPANNVTPIVKRRIILFFSAAFYGMKYNPGANRNI